MLFITRPEARPTGWVALSYSAHWEPWLNQNIPQTIDAVVRTRLRSNLKHLLVGLELKAALIDPHWNRGPGEPEVLFEPYFQNLILEFCVGAFSVLEGLGAAHHLHAIGNDGGNGAAIGRNQWRAALTAIYDEDGQHGLNDAVGTTLYVRDKLHQDQLGAREDIDWHALGYDEAFVPASHAIRTVLQRNVDAVPNTSNLHLAPDN